MKEFKSWTNLKTLITIKDLPLQYQEFDYYYHIWTDEANITYYTELWKDTSQIKGIDVTQNDLDVTDWEDNYKADANQVYPASDITVSQAIDVNVTGGSVTATVDKLKLYSDADMSGEEDKGPVDIIEHTGGYKELAIHDDETHDKLDLVAKDSTSQEIRDTIGQASGSTVLSRLLDIWNKLVELFNNGVAKVKLWDGSNEITTTTDGDKTRLDVDANIRFEDDALVQIENITRLLWDGLLFEVSGFETKQVGDSIKYLVRVDSSYNMHIFGEIASELGAEVYVYENPTISSVGTPVTAINGNRSSINTLKSLIYHEPTISNDGTLIRTMMFSGSNQTSVLGESQSLIFKHGIDYYIKVISRGNGNDINTKYFMYERSIS